MKKPSEITLLAFTLILENYVKTSNQNGANAILQKLWLHCEAVTRVALKEDSIKILTYYKMLQSCSTFCSFFSDSFFPESINIEKSRLCRSLQRTTGNSIDGSLQSFPGRSTFVL